MKLQKPFEDHVDRLTQIVKELKERDEYDKIQGRETVEVFSKKTRLVRPLEKVRTREDVDFQVPMGQSSRVG